MEQKCFFAGCGKRVSIICHCKNQDTYCCSLHQAKHTKQMSDHHIVNLKIKLAGEEYKELSVKAIRGLKYLRSLKKSIINSTLEFINQINLESQKALKKVKDVESEVKFFYATVSLEKIINKEQYQWIKDAEFPDKPTKFEPNKHFSELFEVDMVKSRYENWRECSEIVFSDDRVNGGLWSIDLETLKKVSLDYAPKIGMSSTVCKLDKENYFFYGGMRGRIIGDTVIVNTKKKIFETLQSNSANSSAGSALKDNKVYVFGGTSDWGQPVGSCTVFDLKTKELSKIAAMPVASNCTTAALHKNTIIISGYHLPCLYSFDGSSFLSVLNLPANARKVVFDRWVLTTATMFEANENNVEKWIGINLNPQWSESNLSASTVFKKGNYFYFIDFDSVLWRLDTFNKKIERIVYS